MKTCPILIVKIFWNLCSKVTNAFDHTLGDVFATLYIDIYMCTAVLVLPLLFLNIIVNDSVNIFGTTVHFI